MQKIEKLDSCGFSLVVFISLPLTFHNFNVRLFIDLFQNNNYYTNKPFEKINPLMFVDIKPKSDKININKVIKLRQNYKKQKVVTLVLNIMKNLL